jgi:hypothetical protein
MAGKFRITRKRCIIREEDNKSDIQSIIAKTIGTYVSISVILVNDGEFTPVRNGSPNQQSTLERRNTTTTTCNSYSALQTTSTTKESNNNNNNNNTTNSSAKDIHDQNND